MPSVYVYGVVPTEDSWQPSGFEGVHGEPVRRIDGEQVAALVSDVDDEVLGRRRELLAHTRVLEEAISRGAVVPAQFGTIAPSDAAVVADLLEARGAAIAEQLDAITDLVEVRVSASYVEEQVLAEVVARQPHLKDAAAGGVDARMAVGRHVVEAIDEQRQRDAAALRQRLDPLAVDVLQQEARTDLDLVDLAFLVRRHTLEDFDAAVAEATRPLTQRARVRYVGPMPPASFFSLEQG